MYSPSFTKPTHGYGNPFPQEAPPQDELLAVSLELPDDENWAGKGFETQYQEPECDLCPTPCLGCEKWERPR